MMDKNVIRFSALWRSKRFTSILGKISAYILLIFFAIIFLIPFFWELSSSLKTQQQIFTYPIKWIPNPIVWSNYTKIWEVLPFEIFLKNSIIVSTLVLIGHLLSSTLVAYGFARKRFWGRDILFTILLATMMIPGQVTMIPVFILFRRLGWINTLKPLIVPSYFGSAFYIFLLRQFFLTIPNELDEAAVLDGCSSFRIFTSIILPLSKPALTTVAIFSFLQSWNDFLNPLIYLNSLEKKTLTLGLALFRGEYSTEWGLLMAATVQITLPCLVLFFLCQKYFVEGIVLTGLKQ